MWVLWARRVPYHNIKLSPFQIMSQVTQYGMRPRRSRAIPEKIYELLQLCWDEIPENRPSFEKCIEIFKEIEFLEPKTPTPYLKDSDSISIVSDNEKDVISVTEEDDFDDEEINNYLFNNSRNASHNFNNSNSNNLSSRNNNPYHSNNRINNSNINNSNINNSNINNNNNFLVINDNSSGGSSNSNSNSISNSRSLNSDSDKHVKIQFDVEEENRNKSSQKFFSGLDSKKNVSYL
jgi:hypothetical protein